MTEDRPFDALFLSVGASKCGTTWLYSVMQAHPELYFTPEKELHYFHFSYGHEAILSDERRMANANARVLGRIDPARSNIRVVKRNLQFLDAYFDDPVDDKWYANLFRAKRPGQYSCDFSNFHALLPAHAWHEIAGKCGKLRVLYTMRNPLDRLWSHLKFHLQVTGQADQLDSWSPEEFYAFAKRPFIWDNCEYGDALRKMTAGLSRQMLYVQFYEDLFSRPDEALASLEDFLGIRAHEYPSEKIVKKVNVSAERPMPDFFPELFDTDIERIASEVEELGYELPTNWRR
ncbi:sulfotransferase [Parasedimentitalea marina]|uniref:Sulfotransferase n=1 Tax=Parasedimentitalea marina TaxID=2483033 RepID=A0A3T0N3Z6_9RHOB|nr:sulfotransferase domain-containing protein [Parasedimentitalea marina]AZV78756.1 sulfotransferase [Parasedimentitalea marina]